MWTVYEARQYLNQPSREDASAPTAPRTSSSPVVMDGDAQDTPSTINSEHVSRPLLRQPARNMKPRHTSPSDPPLSESLADVLATNAFDQLSNGEVGYFGSSTNHGFFWCLSGAIANLGYKASRGQAQRASPTSDMRGSRSRVLRKSLPHATLHESVQEYPSNEELVARFFDTIGDVLPYVDEVSIMGKLHVLNEDANESCPSTQSWQALLNIVLAYALYTIDGPSPEPFYRRVINLLYGMAIHLSTVQTLQALLLLSTFEQNIRRSMASLSSHSLAVRTAYHLGLHAPSTILSACFGRPCLIGLALDKIYLSNIGSVRELPTEHLLSEVLNLSIRLDNWVTCNKIFGIMNAEVGFGNWVAPSEDAERLAIILSLHYHRVVLLVHGAILMRSLECLTTVGPQFLSGVTGETIVAMLRRNLVAARDTHYVICEVLQKRLGFLETNALWWICNYSDLLLPKVSCSNRDFPSIYNMFALFWSMGFIQPHFRH
ncbi:fungal specific transcription factor domain protein [Metarhizium robertsii]|uniref:Fungal specific transcription factor domain protein n=1 Tax=Metarhizium robertsii TaxID=568076 RepID=A0A014NA04_9HYPO|nr:fungal specific transcription factor domain protein [Metarhizium robertsii]